VHVRALLNGALAAVAAAIVACDPPPSVTGPHAAIARVHRAHCGECHTRVDPGARTRAQLEAALPRHHNRVHLTDAEWTDLLDYLAADAPPAGDAVTK
jgi:hypothetical protein